MSRKVDPNLRYLFEPRSVAFIGASSRPGKIGHESLRSTVNSGFRGRVYPINPRAESILGLKAYPSILDVPDEVDLAVITLPAGAVPEAMRQCVEKGVKAAVIISGGFAEVGEEGKRVQEEVVRIAREGGIRIVGPNCIGVYDARSGIDTAFQPHERMGRPRPGKAAFLSQSGTFGATFLDWAAEDRLGVSRTVSLGNRADVDEADLIRFLSSDGVTGVIGVYIESFTRGRELLEAIRESSVPVVVYKASRGEAGRKAAISHTGRMVARHEVAVAALRQAGAYLVDSFGELYAAVKALAKQPPFAGGLVLLTNGAGPCVMAADELPERGVTLASMSEELRERLREVLPPYVQIGEFLIDLTGSAGLREYLAALEVLVESDEVAAIGVFVVMQNSPVEEELARRVAEFDTKGKSLLAFAAGGEYTRARRREMEELGVPTYDDVREFAAAAGALQWWGRRVGRAPSV